MNRRTPIVAVIPLVAMVTGVSGQVLITQGSSAPTYQTTLTFDEAGGPTGNVIGNEWTGIGVSELVSGTGVQTVSTLNTQPGLAWLGTGNVLTAPFGAFMTFSQDLTSFSARFWDTSGPGGPFGGGAGIFVYNDGTQVATLPITPAYGGVGLDAINITTSGGATFDEVRLVGFGFSPTSYIDNVSWSAVPTPASTALLALGGLVMARRRRA